MIFGPVCLTDHEAWIEDRKYVHSNGVLYAIKNREADADYVEGEKWLLKNWRGGKCKNKEDQQLFTEAVGEMLKIIQKAVPTGPRRRMRRPSAATVVSVLRTDAATCVSDSSLEEEVVQKPNAPRINLAKAVQLMPMNSLLHTMMILSSSSGPSLPATSNNPALSAS